MVCSFWPGDIQSPSGTGFKTAFVEVVLILLLVRPVELVRGGMAFGDRRSAIIIRMKALGGIIGHRKGCDREHQQHVGVMS